MEAALAIAREDASFEPDVWNKKSDDYKSRLSLPAPTNQTTKTKGRPRRSEVGRSPAKQDIWETSASLPNSSSGCDGASSKRRTLSKHSKEQPQPEAPPPTKPDKMETKKASDKPQ